MRCTECICSNTSQVLIFCHNALRPEYRKYIRCLHLYIEKHRCLFSFSQCTTGLIFDAGAAKGPLKNELRSGERKERILKIFDQFLGCEQ